jgi:acetyl esterase/lipase
MMRVNPLLIAVILVSAVLSARAGQPGGPGGQGGPRGPAVPEGVKVQRDLAYAGDNDRKHKLDLYLPEKAEKPLPLLIWIYGGGWVMGDKAGRSPAVQLAAEGYAVACINYRLSDQAIFPAQIQDCKAAVRWLRANAAKYNIDPDHFGTWGGSAGGHLAALTGTSGGSKEFEPIGGNTEVSDRVQAVCDQYGPTDLLKMDEQAGGRGAFKHDDAKSPESHLIGGPIQENKEKAERANPIRYITKECPPFLIMHGDADNLVPIGQSEILLEALKKQGIEATLITVRSGHGGPAFDQPANVKVVKDFFDKHFKNAGAAKSDSPADAKSNAAKTDASEAAAAKAEKTLAGVQERLTQLQTEQSRLDMEVLKAQQRVNESRAAAGGRGANPAGRGTNPGGPGANPGGPGPNQGGPGPNPGGRGTNFGGRDPNMPPGQGTLRAADSLEYRKACVSAAQQYQVLDTKCLSLVKTMQGLAKESPGLSAELQARISETAAKVAARRRAILEKIGSLYVSAGEWKSALAAYMQVYKDIPEDQRTKESNLMGTLADLCEKVQDYKAAAFFYKSILDGLPEGQRWRNRALCDKLCRVLEQAGDLKSALAVYKSMLEALPPNVRDADRGPATDLNRRIENLERQLGGKQ